MKFGCTCSENQLKMLFYLLSILTIGNAQECMLTDCECLFELRKLSCVGDSIDQLPILQSVEWVSHMDIISTSITCLDVTSYGILKLMHMEVKSHISIYEQCIYFCAVVQCFFSLILFYRKIQNCNAVVLTGHHQPM